MSPNLISTKVNDTLIIQFNLADGDADIGYGPNSPDTISRIHVRDTRYSSYTSYYFPPINVSIENSKYGIQGSCILFISPAPKPRGDSLHKAYDTLTYDIFITDRAGDSSNHIITPPIVIDTLP